MGDKAKAVFQLSRHGQSGAAEKEKEKLKKPSPLSLQTNCSTSRRTGSSTRSSAATSSTRRPSAAAAARGEGPSARGAGPRMPAGAASGTARHSPAGASQASPAAGLRSPAAGRSLGEGPGRIWGRSLPGSRGLRRRSGSLRFFLKRRCFCRGVVEVERGGRGGEGALFFFDDVRLLSAMLCSFSSEPSLSLSLFISLPRTHQAGAAPSRRPRGWRRKRGEAPRREERARAESAVDGLFALRRGGAKKKKKN